MDDCIHTYSIATLSAFNDNVWIKGTWIRLFASYLLNSHLSRSNVCTVIAECFIWTEFSLPVQGNKSKLKLRRLKSCNDAGNYNLFLLINDEFSFLLLILIAICWMTVFFRDDIRGGYVDDFKKWSACSFLV